MTDIASSSSGLDKVYNLNLFRFGHICFIVSIQILKDIKGPQTVSTVAKSAFDWDNYKEKEGIEDDLTAASKDG